MNSFLEAMNNAFIKPRVDVIKAGFVEPVKRGMAAKKRKEDTAFMDELEDEEAVPSPDPRAAMVDEGLAALAGGYSTVGEEDSAPMGNISTDIGEPAEDLYRISADTEDDVPEVSYADLMGPDFSDAVQPVSDEPAESAPMGNASVAGPAPAPEGTKNPLIDPTIGVRQAGIPEETLAALFAKTHGGDFDPNSKTDRLKMSTIRDMLQEDKSLLGLSPTKFAMKVYAR